MIVELKFEDQNQERVKIREHQDQYYITFLDRDSEQEFQADFSECGHFYSVVIDNKPYMVKFNDEGDIYSAVSGPYVSKIRAENEEKKFRRTLRSSFSIKSKSLISKIPGKIIDVLVTPGDFVNIGQDLFILEAMKMENRLFSAREGIVKEILVRKGEIVRAGQTILLYEDKEIN